MWRFWIIGLGAIAAGMAFGQMPVFVAQSLQLNDDQIDLARIQDYLNNIKTLSTKFQQFSSSGDVRHGHLYIWRPNLIRIEYDPPMPMLIISDGSTIVQHDIQLEQTTYLPASSIPLSVLIRDNIHLWNGDILITKFERHEDTFSLKMVLRTDPKAGILTLVFDRNPLQLNKWLIIDNVGERIDVSLIQPQFNVQLQQDLFYLQ